MKRLFPFFGLFFIRFAIAAIAMSCFSEQLWAQTAYLDSLKREIRQHPKNDTLIYKLELGYAKYYYARSNTDSAAYHIEKTHHLVRQMQYADGLADYHHFKAVASKQQGLLDSAIRHARKELLWAVKAADKSKLAFAYNDVGNMHIYFGNGDSATIHLIKGLSIAEKFNNDRLAANISFNLSAAYNMIDNYRASRDYAEKSHHLASAIKDSTYMFHSLYNWATQEFKLGKVDTALTMFEQCVSLAQALGCEECQADVYNNVGEILYSQKRFSESLRQYDKMATIVKRLNDPQYDLYLYMNRGNTLAELGKYRRAEEDLARAQTIGMQLKANFELSELLLFRSELAKKMEDFEKALDFHKEADSLKALIANEKSLEDINRLEIQYRSAEKDKSIAEQKMKLAERQAAIRKKDMLITGLLVGCLLLVTIAFLAYRDIYHRRKLSIKERELHQKKISELEKERQLIAAQSLMKGQEEERGRMARDLHDGVGGLLSGVKLSLSNMKGNVFLSEENVKAIGSIIGQLDSSINELRRVSHNMMPEALIKYGLKEALENYSESIDQSGMLHVRLQTYGLEQRMEQDTEIILYRIVQELLNNVIKHADAKQVLLQLIRERDKFTLTVEDDGKGFDIHSSRHQKGAGLQNIEARVGYLNGVMDIRTKPGEGTSITIEGTLI